MNEKSFLFRKNLWVLVLVLMISMVLPLNVNYDAIAQLNQSVILPESNDFATQELNDAWDMNQFTDISQRLNYVEDNNNLLNINVADGVFSATAEGNYSEFFPLFSGWNPAILHGKIGELHPIDSSQYQCFYMSMKTDKRAEFHIFAAKDRDFLLGNYPETNLFETYWNFSEPSDYYRLQKINLAQTEYDFYRNWTDLEEWKAFRINPVLEEPGTKFSVDWIRLTDCQPINLPINGLESQKPYDVWLQIDSPERTVLAAKNISSDLSGKLLFDTQGLEPNTYSFSVKDAGKSTVRSTGQFTVNAQPQVDILRPSPPYGEDFASSLGAAWDMSGPEDVWAVRNTNGYEFDQGVLKFYTNPGSWSRIPDPIIYMSIPETAAPADYRYLSFRMYQNGNIAQPGEGMIARWVWIVNQRCDYVSLDIPLEVGWHTYTIDLYDPNNGMPVSNDCGAPNRHWREFTDSNVNFRFDPNENVTDFQFYQELDWIKLTKEDRVKSGQIYTIEYIPSEEELQSLIFYYTNDLSFPKKYRAVEFIPNNGNGVPPGPNLVYLPLILKNPINYEFPIFKWNTTGVAPGEYFVCSVSNDGYNEAIDCSEAPLIVTAN